MRALVTGAGGFDGRHLVAALLARGDSVAALVGSRRLGVEAVPERAVEITDVDAVAEAVAAAEPDVVFHLAAIVDTVETANVPRLYDVNVLGTAAVIEGIRRAAPEARLVFTSSAFAYGRVEPGTQAIRESQPLAPVTPYGASKAAAEALVGQFVRAGGDAVVARAFTHTGPGHVGRYALADWSRQLAEIAAGERAPRISCGNLDVSRDYLDVRDVVSAYIVLAERGESGETYNVGSGVPVTMRALLDGLVQASGLEVEIEVEPQRLRSVDQAVFYADIAKLRDLGNWEPQFELDETLRDVIAFWNNRLAELPAGG